MDTDIYSYDDQIQKIDSVKFTIWSNEEILRNSAVGKDTDGISIADLYDNQEPKQGGLIDLRLGPSNDSFDCETCGLNNTYCIGHFGHLTLADWVFHAKYIRYVKKILSCICIQCSKLLIYKNENEIMNVTKNSTGRARLAEMHNAVKNVTYCQKSNYGCGAPVPKIKLDIKKSTGAINLYAETNIVAIPGEENDGKKKNRQNLTPAHVYDILKGISDEDCLLLGIDPTDSRPESMIQKIFPIPPVQIRPSVRAEFMASSIMEDDLTHKLADIIKANERIAHQNENENSTKFAQDHLHLLQYQVAYYLDSESNIPKSEDKGGKQRKTLGPRLKGKEGRVRGNLMGKRVDFSARTVITSDPTLDINQLGIPVRIAKTITFPEVVTPQNIGMLTKLVKNGRDKYPGANFVFPASVLESGARIMPLDLRFRKEKLELKYGDIVERHILDGDIVLFNRQPTLHKQSMMGHRAKIINDESLNTFRLTYGFSLKKRTAIW